MEDREDWLDPQLGYGGSRPLFDPSTWTVAHDAKEPERGGAAYELYNRKNLHELVHWLQHAGTTWGVFASLCQLGESQRVAKWLGELGAERRERFFSEHEAGRTPLSIDPDTGDLKTNDPDLATAAPEILGHYVGLLYGGHVLRDASRLQASRAPLGPLLAQAMSIVQGFPWPLERPSYAPFGEDVATGKVRRWSEVEQEISIVDVLESAALVNETMSVGHAYEGDLDSDEFHASVREAVRRLFGAEHERYSVAFRIWVGRHEELRELGAENPDMRDLGRATLSFALLADAALNPPLPPVYRFDDPAKSLWKDVDPAIRFNLLIQAGAAMPLPDAEIDSAGALAWTLDLLDRAGLPGLHRDVAAFRDLDVRMTYDHPDDFSYVESILLPRFLALFRLRAHDLLSVAAPGEMVQRESLQGGSRAEEAFHESFWVPLFLNADSEFISFMPPEAAARYCESVHLRRALRFAPHRTMEGILKRRHHRAFADMRPKIDGFEADSLRNWSRQYTAWFEED